MTSEIQKIFPWFQNHQKKSTYKKKGKEKPTSSNQGPSPVTLRLLSLPQEKENYGHGSQQGNKLK